MSKTQIGGALGVVIFAVVVIAKIAFGIDVIPFAGV